MFKVSGKEINEKEFAYDGCHKIYILKTQDEKEDAKGLGYKIYSIKKLQEKFESSCPLRFISYWDLSEVVVSQCTNSVKFEGFEK